MDRLDIGLISIGVSLFLMALRVPIGVVLVSVSFVGIAFMTSMSAAWGALSTIPYSFIATWELSAIPMFLLMGFIAARTGTTSGLFTSMRLLFKRLPGSLASASVAATALVSAASGSSVATAAAMSRIAVPEMLRAGYQPALATGTIAAAGTLGAMIPPSILMVIYGVFTNTPVGPLFIAGVMPGLLTALAFVLMITLRVILKPSLAPRATFELSREERMAAYRDLWPMPTLIVTILGGIFLGIFSPTEAGAIAAATIMIVAFVRRSLNLTVIREAIVDTAKSTSAIFFIALGAAMYQRLLGLSQVPSFFSANLLSFSDNILVIILFVAIIYLILGMFLESIGLMLLTLPVIMPLLVQLDVNLIWFGIVTIKLLEIGLVTPPVGLNVYVIKSALGSQVALSTIFRGCGWFIATDFVVLTLLVLFPAITLFLPEIMR